MALTVTRTSSTPGVEVWLYDNLDTADTSPTPIRAGSQAPLGALSKLQERLAQVLCFFKVLTIILIGLT